MQITMLQGKIHRATVTQAELDYVGSITVDEDLLDAAGIKEYQLVQIVDVNNGNRFETYTIAGERGSGVMCLNGAAARCVSVHDKIILMAYAQMTPEEAKENKPNVVFVDDENKNQSCYKLRKTRSFIRHGEVRIKMLKGKTVVLGVTGSIAAYKIASLASMLVKQHCDVHVIMTKNATNFINPIAFETLTNNKCLVDTFDRNFQFHVAHVSLAQKADVMMIAPASANIIAKLAHGIADDMLSTTALACSAKKIISPAMNVHMFENPIVQDNLNILKKYDMEVVEPAVGYLACGDTGAGKMPEPEVLFEYILREIACEKDLKGKKIW